MKLAGPLFLVATIAVGCISKPAEAPPALQSCADVAQAFAAEVQSEGRQLQGQGLPDGGLIVGAVGLKDIRFLAVISEKQAPKFLTQLKEAKLKLQGEVGQCSHPESGYPYRSVQFVKEQKFEKAGI